MGNAEKNTVVCDTMTSCHNINVQAIDYPAVGKGEELLRIAPTTDHTPQMMIVCQFKNSVANPVFVEFSLSY